MGSMKDFYSIMGLQRNATMKQVRDKYLLLAKELHPDKSTGNVEAFKALQEAYATLGDPGKRRAYDNLTRKVREFVPPVAQGGAVDLLGAIRQMSAGRVPQQFVDAFLPVIDRKLDEHGVKATAATAEDIATALGWLKPKRKKRA